MRKFKVLKLPNVSESVSPIFYKRKRYTNVLFHKMFFPKNGGGPGGPTQAQSACPYSLEKKVLWKRTFLVGRKMVFSKTFFQNHGVLKECFQGRFSYF